MPRRGQRCDSGLRDNFRRLKPVNDTAVGLLRPPWESVWREERRAGDTGLKPHPSPGMSRAHSLPLQGGGQAAWRQGPAPTSKPVSAKDQPSRTVDFSSPAASSPVSARGEHAGFRAGGWGARGCRAVWGELRTRAACGVQPSASSLWAWREPPGTA